MLRIILAAVAALFVTTNASHAFFDPLDHKGVALTLPVANPGEFLPWYGYCDYYFDNIVEKKFRGNVDVLAVLNHSWNELGLDNRAKANRLIHEVGVPEKCILTIRQFVAGTVKNHLLLLSGEGHILTNDPAYPVVNWDELRRKGNPSYAVSSFFEVTRIIDGRLVTYGIANNVVYDEGTPSFEEFPARERPVTIHVPEDLVFMEGTYAKLDADEVRARMTGVPNFADHYEVVWWSDGTAAYAGALIDLATGVVTDLPSLAVHWEFEKDSRLFVSGLLDPKDPEYVPAWLTTRYYEWNGSEFVEIARTPPTHSS